MSQASELLNSLNEEEVSAYAVDPVESDHIVIGSDRFITIPERLKRIAVQHDHNVETVTFDCPRYWDGRDLYEMQIYINYLAPGARYPDAHLAENKVIDPFNESIIHFDWTIEDSVTSVKGVIDFLVCGKKTETNEDGENVLVNHWNSELNEDMYVSEGMEATAHTRPPNSDIITQLLTRMDVVEAVKGDAIAAAEEAAGYSQAAGVQASAASDYADRAEASLNAARVVAGGVVDVEARGKANQKDIVNFEKDLIFTKTDASSAHVKNVPENALPYAEVTRIGGGLTRKCKNICPVASITTKEGQAGTITIPATRHGAYTLSCDVTKFADDTATNTRIAIRFNYTDGTQSYAGCPYDTNNAECDGIKRHKVVTHTSNANKTLKNIDIFCLDYGTPNNRNAKAENIQLEFGDVETEYEPYFEGIKVAKVTGFKSAGKNLIPFPYVAGATKTINGITFTANSDGGITIRGTNTHTTYVEYALITTNSIKWGRNTVTASLFGATSDDIYITIGGGGFSFGEVKAGASITLTNNGTTNVFAYGLIRVKAGATVDATVYPMINEGSVALPYEPYVEHCLDIPTALVERGDYCLTLPGTDLENVVEWKPGYGVKRMVKKIGCADMGTLSWSMQTSNNRYIFHTSSIKDIKICGSASAPINAICTLYKPVSTSQTWVDKDIAYNAVGINRVDVVNNDYTDAASFKAAMNGVMLYYELATPEIVDLSGFLTDDNKLGVEGAVTVTVENEEGRDIPTTIEYPLSMDLGEKVLRNQEHATINAKRLINLEKALMAETEDSAVAYTKDVPANALPYARVTKVGGLTRKCTNLIPFPYCESSHAENGITWTVNADGSVTANGTATNTSTFALYKDSNTEGLAMAPGVYTLSGCPSGGGDTKYYIRFIANDSGNVTTTDAGNGTTTTVTSGTPSNGIYIRVYAGQTVNNLVFRPMLNEGSVALPYEPYFEGLRDAKVTEIESVGANIIPFPFYLTGTREISGVTFTVNDNQSITLNGTVSASNGVPIGTIDGTKLSPGSYFASLETVLPSGCTFYSSATGTSTFTWIPSGGKNNVVTIPQGSWMLSNTAFQVRLWIEKGATFNNVTIYPFIAKSDVAVPYAPYAKHTMPIPEAVQALDGYGWGVNDEVYNYIDFDKKQFVKRIGCMDIGWLEWRASTTPNNFYAHFLLKAEGIANILCANYSYHGVGLAEMNDKSIRGDNWGKNIYVKDLTYTDAASFKAAMAGVMLYYELAEPIVTDISDILPADNLLGVEGVGTVTAVNEYGREVPTTIVYSNSK